MPSPTRTTYLLFSPPKGPVPSAPRSLPEAERNRIITEGYAAQTKTVEDRRLAIKADITARMGWEEAEAERLSQMLSGWSSVEIAVRAAFHDRNEERFRLYDYEAALLAAHEVASRGSDKTARAA